MAVLETIPVATAHDLVAILRRSHPLWQGRSEAETDWEFRGQRKASWPLLPSAYRQPRPNSLLDLYTNFLGAAFAAVDWHGWSKPNLTGSHWTSRLPEVALHTLVHATVVRDFALLADDVRTG